MCLGKVKVFLLLFVVLVFTFYFYVSIKTYSMVSNDDVGSLSNTVTVVSPLLNEIIKNTSTALIEQKNYKYISLLLVKRYRTHKGVNFSKFNENFGVRQKRNLLSYLSDSDKHAPLQKFVSDLSQKEKFRYQYVFDERVQKRNAVDENGNERKGLLKGKQRKAQALGRLLLNNVSNKNDEDIQDDYTDDDDDNYSDGVNRKKMNWEDYQNEDGSSIMELIALNTRHKTYMRRED